MAGSFEEHATHVALGKLIGSLNQLAATPVPADLPEELSNVLGDLKSHSAEYLKKRDLVGNRCKCGDEFEVLEHEEEPQEPQDPQEMSMEQLAKWMQATLTLDLNQSRSTNKQPAPTAIRNEPPAPQKNPEMSLSDSEIWGYSDEFDELEDDEDGSVVSAEDYDSDDIYGDGVDRMPEFLSQWSGIGKWDKLKSVPEATMRAALKDLPLFTGAAGGLDPREHLLAFEKRLSPNDLNPSDRSRRTMLRMSLSPDVQAAYDKANIHSYAKGIDWLVTTYTKFTKKQWDQMMVAKFKKMFKAPTIFEFFEFFKENEALLGSHFSYMATDFVKDLEQAVKEGYIPQEEYKWCLQAFDLRAKYDAYSSLFFPIDHEGYDKRMTAYKAAKAAQKKKEEDMAKERAERMKGQQQQAPKAAENSNSSKRGKTVYRRRRKGRANGVETGAGAAVEEVVNIGYIEVTPAVKPAPSTSKPSPKPAPKPAPKKKPVLPPELLHDIFLRLDLASVKSAALVCKDWHAVSQKLIWRTLVFTGGDHAEDAGLFQLNRRWHPEEQIHEKYYILINWDRIDEFWRRVDKLPTAQIKVLKIHVSPPLLGFMWGTSNHHHIGNPQLFTLLEKNLQRIEITVGRWIDAMDDRALKELLAAPIVQRLPKRVYWQKRVVELLTGWAEFTNMEDLLIMWYEQFPDQMTWDERKRMIDVHPDKYKFPSALQGLDLRDYDPMQLIPDLRAATAPCTQLKRLEVSVTPREHYLLADWVPLTVECLSVGNKNGEGYVPNFNRKPVKQMPNVTHFVTNSLYASAMDGVHCPKLQYIQIKDDSFTFCETSLQLDPAKPLPRGIYSDLNKAISFLAYGKTRPDPGSRRIDVYLMFFSLSSEVMVINDIPVDILYLLPFQDEDDVGFPMFAGMGLDIRMPKYHEGFHKWMKHRAKTPLGVPKLIWVCDEQVEWDFRQPYRDPSCHTTAPKGWKQLPIYDKAWERK